MPGQFGAPDGGGARDEFGARDEGGAPDPFHPPAPGEFRVKGYEIDSLLSATASGEVWLAHAQVTGDQVALKRLQLRSEDARAEAERLVSVLHLVDHPHLLRVRELLPAGRSAVLVLDYADGGSLDQLLTGRGGLDPGEVVTAVAPVAEALAAAHEHGLVHGDVTPEAILFTTDGRPLLSDVGILGLVEDGHALGTHGYADPTAAGAESGPTPAGDVYGLAAVCYTALTGLAPRPGEPRRPLSEAIPGLPQGLAHAVGVGLQPVAERRPDAAQFADLLYAACDPAPVRFPVGLVLSDADIAAVLGGSAPPDSDASAPKDPFAQRLGAQAAGDGPGGPQPPQPPAGSAPPVGEQLAGAPAPYAGDPYAGVYDAPSFGGRAPADEADDEDDDRSGRRRVGLILAAALGVLLLSGAVVGGIAWATRTRPVDPAAAGHDSQASPRDGAAEIPAPGRPARAPSRDGRSRTEPSPTPTRATTPPAAPESGPEARWRQVLADLDDQRAKAFEQSDPALLGPVYEPGSDLAAKDRAEIDKCVSRGCHVEGLRFDVKRLTVVSESSDRVVLEVVDQLQSYSVVSDAGERTDQPAGEVTTRRITLIKNPGAHWVIARIIRQ